MSDNKLTSSGESLRNDYDATLRVFTQLVDTRFKLLAAVPVATGIAIRSSSAALASLGLIVTIGLIVYEMRNSQLHDNAVHRLKWLEGSMSLPSSVSATETGGAFSDIRSTPNIRTAGGVRVVHDRALGLVYGSVVGAWVARIAASVSAQSWLVDVLPWVGRVQNWVIAAAGAVSGVVGGATIIRGSQRGRAVKPIALTEDHGLGDLGVALDAARANRRAEYSAGLRVAEQLGLIEARRVVGKRQSTNDGPWWMYGRIDDGAVRRRILPKGSEATVHLRAPNRVRPRLTPWGELLRENPDRGTNAEAAESRARLLETHLTSRVSGLAALLEDLRRSAADDARGSGAAGFTWLSPTQVGDIGASDEMLKLLQGAGVVESAVSPVGDRLYRPSYPSKSRQLKVPKTTTSAEEATFFSVATTAPS